ncbi:MAG: TonB-dependent receptor [Spirosomataceae bacterium]
MKFISFFSIIFLFCYALIAQPLTQTIKGRVVDAESGLAVIGANVAILNLSPQKGSSTDAQGYFKIQQVPVGRYTIKITSLGYEDATIQELSVGSGKEIDLTIKLTESLHQLAEVTIKAQKQFGEALNDMASISARSFTVEQTKRYAASINDPARMAQSFAGVTTTDDTNNQIIIRGNSPKGLLWRMEGVEVPNPNHFAEEGSTGGGISALSVNVLSNSDFFTGAFPAEYGNATSGVFDLRMRRGNNEKHEYALQAGIIGIDVAAEGPFAKQGGASYLANYRYSSLDLLNSLGFQIAGDAVPKFQDAAFKLHFPLNTKTTLSVWGMGGLSKQEIDKATYQEAFHSDRGMSGVNYVRQLNEKAFIEAIVAFAYNRSKYDYTRKDRVQVSAENFEHTALRASLLYNHKFSAKHTLRTGFIASNLAYNLLDKNSTATQTNVSIDQHGQTQLLQAYAQWKYRLSQAVTFNTGFHTMFLTLSNQFSVEPRMGLRWAVAPGHTLSAGFGLHSRMESISTYLAQIQVTDKVSETLNKNLKFPKAAHGVLGYEFRPNDEWRIQTEVYYQYLYNVPIGLPTATDTRLRAEALLNAVSNYVNDALSSDGTGRNYGLEITIEKFLTRGFYLLSTTSLYDSRYTARDGVLRSTRFNGQFVQNLLAGKEWKVGRTKTNLIAFNTRVVWAGGNHIVPVDLTKSIKQNTTVRDYANAYGAQLPNYFRPDIRISYTKNRKKTTSTLSLDIQNIINRLNAYNLYYDSATKQIQTDTQMGLIPILNYRLEF